MKKYEEFKKHGISATYTSGANSPTAREDGRPASIKAAFDRPKTGNVKQTIVHDGIKIRATQKGCERIAQALDLLRSVDPELLGGVRDGGYTVVEFPGKQGQGFCEAKNRIVAVSSQRPEKYCEILAHEFEHARQFQDPVIFEARAGEMNTYGFYAVGRATEAAARATEFVTMVKLKDKLPEDAYYQASREGNYLGLAEHYMKSPGGEAEARKAVFQAWYNDYRMTDAYDFLYLGNLEGKDKRDGKAKRKKSFQKSMDTSKVFERLCRYGSGNYMAGQDISAARYMRIPRMVFDGLEALQEKRGQEGLSFDRSIYKFHVVENDWTVTPPQTSKIQPPVAALVGRGQGR